MGNLAKIYLGGKYPPYLDRLNHYERLLANNLMGSTEKTVDWTPVISVSDALAKPVVDYQFKITAKQTGTPSPQNICPIDGWMGANISVNSSIIPISWQTEAGTVYGGVRNLTTGELTVTHIKKKIGDESITWNYQSSGGRLYTQSLNTIIVKAPSNQTAFPEIIKCTCYKTVSATSTGASTGNLGIAVSNSGAIYLRDENYSNASDFVRDMGDEYILYQLAEPITYTLTPTEITLAEGANTLWSDTGDSKLTYLAKK